MEPLILAGGWTDVRTVGSGFQLGSNHCDPRISSNSKRCSVWQIVIGVENAVNEKFLKPFMRKGEQQSPELKSEANEEKGQKVQFCKRPLKAGF